MYNLLRRMVASGSKSSELVKDSEKSKLIRKFGRKGHGKGQFIMPCGVTVSKSGNIIVVDTDNHRIQIFSADGVFKYTFGKKGNEDNQLCYPLCVAMTTDDCIAVTDTVNASVKIFSQSGDLQSKFGGVNVLELPYGLAITYDSFLVITDICKHCVYVLYPSGGVCKTFGSYGNGPREFDHPYFVCVNTQKQIIVSDSGNSSIKIFHFDGKLLRIFSTEDFHLNDNFINLQGLCTDKDDNTIVLCNSTAYILTKNGRLWEVLTAQDGLNYPKCIAYSQSGRLIVTQNENCEISLFEYHSEDFKSLNSLLFYAISV